MNMTQPKQGRIFNIERFAVHDGPGIRALVFFKGCPLRCDWCSNPESQRVAPEIMINGERCIKTAECRRCLEACRLGAISFTEKDSPQLDRTRCDSCGDCVQACPAKAIELFGRDWSVAGILETILQDVSFFSRSGGGITLSGGEPLLQPDFAGALLDACRQQGIGTALETCGQVPWASLEKVADSLQTIYYDVKAMDPEVHRRHTGEDNRLILDNLRKLSAFCSKPKIIIRTPVIPGVNDSEENIGLTATLARELPGVKDYELLAYHRFGEGKYRNLGLVYPMKGVEKLSPDRLASLKDLACDILNKNTDK